MIAIQRILPIRIKIFWLIGSLLYSGMALANTQKNSPVTEPIFFINQGQWSPNVLAKATLNLGDFWLTRDGFVINCIDTSATE
ncbi:MAG: hypothetical protein RLZZ504_1390, partial [Bacteroidota bacterium]